MYRFLSEDDCWRLVDVRWASEGVLGGDSGDWLLLDDNGRVIKDPLAQQKLEPRSLVCRVNEFYFLTDPHEFIFRYRSIQI